MSRWLVLAACLSAAAAATPARAAGRDPAAAEVLFQEGRDALQRGNLAVACDKFRESERLDPGVGTLMNWADCEEKLGHLASAWERWHEAVDQLAPNDDRIGYARDRAAALDKRVPRLIITLAGATDARVFRDDVELGSASLGSPLPIEPGTHTIRVVASGHLDRELTVQIAEGQRESIEVTPGPSAQGAPSGEGAAAAGAKPSARRTWGWVALGVGAAGVAGAVVTGILIQHDRSIVQERCNADKLCDTEGYQAAQSGRKLLVPNLALWGVGVAGAGLGAYLLLSHKPTATTTALAAHAIAGGAVFGCEGRF